MQVVHYKVGKTNFEIATKKGSVTAYKNDKSKGLKNVLDSEIVWKDLKKGERASGQELMAAFKTDDVLKVAEVIIEKGDLQLTEAERKEIMAKKRNEIVNYIHKYYVDPKTGFPHPIIRIDAALNESKVRIDPDAPTEKQVTEFMKSLITIIPCKKTEISGTVVIPLIHQKAANSVISKYAKIVGQKKSDTGLTVNITCVPGDFQQLINELNQATKGECDIQFDSAPDVGETQRETTNTSPKNSQKTTGKGGKK